MEELSSGTRQELTDSRSVGGVGVGLGISRNRFHEIRSQQGLTPTVGLGWVCVEQRRSCTGQQGANNQWVTQNPKSSGVDA